MTRDELLVLREEADFEAKAAQGRDGRGELPHSVWETYSAMANTGGGRILLGARERKDGSLVLQGIADSQRVRKALWDGLNNRQVVSHNLLANDDVEVLAVDGVEHPLVLVTVPRATRKQRPVYLGHNPLAGTYKRNYEGDYRCSEAEVRRLLAEAERDTRDSEVLNGFGLDDLDAESLAAFRNLFRAAKPAHPWLALDDLEMLRRLGGWGRDRERNAEGLTLAGLLMFGESPTIREALPDFILDYREHMAPEVRWTDRVTTDGTWPGNLFDFYRRVYPRLVDGLRVPFRLEEGARRVDETPVHVALREALVNAVIHADYHLSTGILVHKYPDRFEFGNPGNLRVPRSRALQGGVSDCRNRSLQKMFQMIGAGEQAGSGIPLILSAWQEQHWRAPLLEEQTDPERTILRLSMFSLLPVGVITELVNRFGEVYRSLPRGRAPGARHGADRREGHQRAAARDQRRAPERPHRPPAWAGGPPPPGAAWKSERSLLQAPLRKRPPRRGRRVRRAEPSAAGGRRTGAAARLHLQRRVPGDGGRLALHRLPPPPGAGGPEAPGPPGRDPRNALRPPRGTGGGGSTVVNPPPPAGFLPISLHPVPLRFTRCAITLHATSLRFTRRPFVPHDPFRLAGGRSGCPCLDFRRVHGLAPSRSPPSPRPRFASLRS